MIYFALIIFIWAAMGLIGVLNCKNEGVNYSMLFFIFEVPFLPLIANFFQGADNKAPFFFLCPGTYTTCKTLQ